MPKHNFIYKIYDKDLNLRYSDTLINLCNLLKEPYHKLYHAARKGERTFIHKDMSYMKIFKTDEKANN